MEHERFEDVAVRERTTLRERLQGYNCRRILRLALLISEGSKWIF